MNAITDTVEILKLEGTGYSLAVLPQTEEQKQGLITAAAAVTQVTNNDESGVAQFQIRNLAAFRIQVEKARVEAKKPILELGRKIDAAVADFVGLINSEGNRLKLMVGDHAKQVLEEKRKAEAEERRKFEEAKRAKEAEEAAAREVEEARKKAADAKSIADVIEAKRRERVAEQAARDAADTRMAANVDRFEASSVVAATKINAGVRMVDDFEVEDLDALYKYNADMVAMSPRANEIKRLIGQFREAGKDPVIPGVRVFQKPAVSTR